MRDTLILLFILFLVLCLGGIHVVEGMHCGMRSGGRRSGMRSGNRRGGRRSGNRGIRRYYGGPGGRPRHRGFRWRRGPTTVVYDTLPYYWGGWRENYWPDVYAYYPSWLWGARCKKGCGYLGNNSVGCVDPSNHPDSCIFASDCYGC